MAEDKQYVEVVKKSLEQLDKYQKNAELIISAFNQFANIDIKVKEYTDEEKLRAAYALNLCTVSVSQIIDYDDIEILEQEYEMILNNLNLENMPKDEALLNILKRILDVITFFRIQDGDKKFIDKEYQHKMKNAVWTAVPNFGLIVAGGNPITMAISLASQVGIGYMNYRRMKAENQLEEERANWKLQRAAIEQLNGLCRELFDTAWRLADEYKFPDEYRLTEKQIKQYNTILMDTDPIRKYERLDSIKDKFKAYVPFWYHFGNTANQIAQNPKFSKTTRNKYYEAAINYFEIFFRINDKNILREDQILAACALEYIDLLNAEKDADKINQLLELAIRNAGEQWDVLQLCAISYLKNKNTDKAAVIFKQLVNENYNTILNAQILSNIYVSNFFYTQNKETALSDYEILETRVEKDYLFPIPRDGIYDIDKLNKDFLKNQRHILKIKYHNVLNEFIKKYTIKYNKVFPVEGRTEEYDDTYFLDGYSERTRRFNDIERIFCSKRKKEAFCNKLKDEMVVYNLFEVINEMYINLVTNFKRNIDDEFEEILKMILIHSIVIYRDEINKIMSFLSENQIDKINVSILSNIPFKDIIYDFFKELDKNLIKDINECKNMFDIAMVESELYKFCISQNLSYPQLLYKKKNNIYERTVDTKIFMPSLLGLNYAEIEKTNRIKRKFIEIINNNKENLIVDNKTKLILGGTIEFDTYFSKADKKLSKWKNSTVAIIAGNNDLMMTIEGIAAIRSGIISEVVPYDKVKLEDDVLVGKESDILVGKESDIFNISLNPLVSVFPTAHTIKKAHDKIIHFKYKNNNVNITELYSLIHKLDSEIPQCDKFNNMITAYGEDYYDFLNTVN